GPGVFIRVDRLIVTTRIRTSPSTGWPCSTGSNSTRALRSAVPVDSMAPATGISAASSTTTGQSMALYTSLGGTVRKAIDTTTPSANETAAGTSPTAA